MLVRVGAFHDSDDDLDITLDDPELGNGAAIIVEKVGEDGGSGSRLQGAKGKTIEVNSIPNLGFAGEKASASSAIRVVEPGNSSVSS